MSGQRRARIRLLEVLRDQSVETHLVMSKAAALTINAETDRSVDAVRALADVSYPVGDVGAGSPAGSFRTRGMVIAPCSIVTLCRRRTVLPETLVQQRRRDAEGTAATGADGAGNLVACRSPRLMSQATEAGAIIMPPVPAFYARPSSPG